MAAVVAQHVPTSTSMAVFHEAAGVCEARRRMRAELRAGGAPESVVDDAVLILSELLGNACRHARPLHHGAADGRDEGPWIRARWSWDTDGRLTVSVTDGGGPTRPRPATPSISARGGRGLAIVSTLAHAWGVEDGADGTPDAPAPAAGDDGPRTAVTVWATLTLY